MKNIFFIVLIAFSLASCDKVEHPFPPSIELDTTIYPGNWSEYETTIWPTFDPNTNTNRNFLIEDFTGHKCIYCPLAAVEAEELEHEYPNRVFTASIHSGAEGLGSFQELHAPLYLHDFTNPQGLEIGKFFGSKPGSAFVGNPWGAVSRIPINGENTLMHSQWANKLANYYATNDLKVNIQAKLNYYDETKGFYLHTEIEKIGTINTDLAQVVYLMEDSIIKPQSFPGGIDSLNYVHRNVQRNCIDGKAFGRTLSDADKKENGKYYIDYSYKIPLQYNPSNMHLLVYVLDKVSLEIYQVIRVEIE
ncbi:MAG: Omp28-related outer membrane protein [Bacteroidota bacterium]